MRASPGVFIAGTDTEVGKTHAGVSLIRTLVDAGRRVAPMKPVAAGAEPTADGLRNADALALAAAANVSVPYDRLNPYCLTAPVSPHIAAKEEGIRIETAHIARELDLLSRTADCVVVEGAGGWLAPISDRETMADVARALTLPVVLVVGLRLGCLNHAQLTARAIESSGLKLAGWVANQVDPHFERLAENQASLERLLGRPALAFIPHDASPRALTGSARTAACKLLAA